MTDFSAIVVLHDSQPHLERLLDSIDRHLPGRIDLVAVDTGSSDDGPQTARASGARVIERPDNPGFGAANNAGIEHATHDVTALLNPDVRLLDDGLARLVDEARARDALLFPRLLNPDGTVQDSAHPEPGTTTEVLRALLPGTGEPWRASRPRQVGWAIAAALVARTETLRRLGPFDPDAFLFYEDMDLCLRADVPVELRPEVSVLHVGGHSTDETRLRHEARRRREVVARRRGELARAKDDLAQAITFARAAAVKPRSRRQLAALLGAVTRP